jgi:predicted transposase/invertase (TIGR01784 family)
MSAKIGIRAWIDFAFRKIFGKPGNEICLISLLNAILDLPQSIESVEFMNPFSYKDFEDDKLICVDVKATDQAGRVFIVEVQIVVHPSFAKRAVYYACKGYSDQLQAGQGYSKLKATYSVCLLMRKLWEDGRLHHQFQLVERASGKVLEDSIEIHMVELSKYNGTLGTIPPQSSVLEQWCYWIKHSGEHTAEELRELLPGLAFLRATKELGDIQTITEEKAMYDSREKAILDYESNLFDAREEGREEGLEQGEAIGIEKGRIQLLQELLGGPALSKQELSVMSLEELQTTTKSLQSKLRDRNA